MGQTIVQSPGQRSFAGSNKLDVRISKCECFHEFLVNRVRELGREKSREGWRN